MSDENVPALGRAVLRGATITISLGLGAVMLVVVLPQLTGIGWSVVHGRLLTLSVDQVSVLTIVWLAGLFTHTYVMVAALPALGHRRAMMLNFSGSAVSNVVPFGGVFGMGMNYSMLRSWGFSRNDFTLMTILTNTCTVLAKLILPSLGLLLLLASGGVTNPGIVAVAVGGLGLLVVIGASVTGITRGRRARTGRPSVPGRRWDRVVTCVAGSSASDVRRDLGVLARRGARRFTLAAVGYALLQALLLGLCLHAFSSNLSVIDVFAGYTGSAALTLVPITPGGIGVTEAGTAALLIALGGDPATTTAAVLLFRTFTFLLEIPAGALCAAAWWIRRPRSPATSP